MLDDNIKLKDIYNIASILKANRCVTQKELEEKCNLNRIDVINIIKYLEKNGYTIENMQDVNGGYIYKYKEYKEQVKLREKVNEEISCGMVDLYKNNVLTKDIKEVSNRTQQTIYYHLRKHRIKPNRKRESVKEYEIEKLYNKGLTIKQIANTLNITENYANNLIYKFIKGTRRHRIENREEIKKYIIDNPNISGKEIAQKYNVSPGTITYLKKEIKNKKN